MTRLLASVQDVHEAQIALAGGADIVDFKHPSQGALGALSADTIAAGVRRVERRALTSATAGDWPLEPGQLTSAAARIGATGVDYVKLGLLPGPALGHCIDALNAVARECRLVAVFFADRGVPLQALEWLQHAGFSGAMIDTFDKAGGGLRNHLSEDRLRAFVIRSRALGLLTGLAGSLRVDDIAVLRGLGPDLLGFRGALCEGHDRNSALSLARLRSVREALPPPERL